MPQDRTRLSLPDVKHLLTAGGLVAGTLGTLLLGAAFQVDPQTVASPSTALITTPPVAGGSLAPPERAPALPEPIAEKAPLGVPSAAPKTAKALSLADRADDPRRMLSGGNAWTLQFMVTCNDDSARRVLEDVGGDPRLYLLPLSLNDRPCFRICWDTFRSRDRAVASRDVPASLRAINAEPIARQVTDVVP